MDLFRCIAILAVILIHATSQPVAKLPVDSTLYPIYYVLNTASGFAVPAFLFLSGLVLFYNYSGREQTLTSWLTFFRKRVTYIIIPYIIWSLFYFVVTRYLNGADVLSSWHVFWDKLLDGTNYTHLYFIIVIVQFYVLFPFIMSLVNRFAWIGRYLVWIGIALQLAFFIWDKYGGLQVKSSGSVFFTYLLFYFVGGYIGLHFKSFMQHAIAKAWLWYAIWGAAGFVFVWKGWMRITRRAWMQDYIVQINFVTYYVYVTLTCIALLLLCYQVQRRFSGKLRMFYAWGALSFGLYFIHPFILFLWRREFQPSAPMLYHLSIIGGFTAALLLAWLASFVISKFKGNWLLLGK
nr:acyltransferase [Paenibacillus phyllosphaerae]